MTSQSQSAWLRRGTALSTPMMALLAVFAQGALAQDVQVAQATTPAAGAPAARAAAQKPALEEVVVTGSRIRRPELVSSSPVKTVTAVTFERAGAATIDGVLNTLPQVVPSLGASSNNGGNGTATVDLRGIGASRTLVLVNGRRYIPTNGGGTVDLNNIPAALVKETQVLTGGASAVYGSDALAGVVNFILKDDFRGAELGARWGATDRGDANEYTGNMLLGGGSEDGRTNVALFVEYNSREELFAGQRSFSNSAITEGFFNGSPSIILTGSSTSPNGRLARGSTVLTWDAAGNPRPFDSVRTPTSRGDLYNFAPINYLRVPQTRYSSFATGSHEFNKNLKIYSEMNFTYNQVPLQLAETPAVIPQPRPGIPPVRINLTNPLLTPATVAALRSLYPDATNPNYASITTSNALSRRMTELGPRAQENNQGAFNGVFGAKGELPFDFNYDTYLEYGRVNNDRLIFNDVSSRRLRQALDATRGANGQAVCVDTSGGCAPISLFGAGAISPAAAKFIRENTLRVLQFEQLIWNGTVNGNLFKLPAGQVGVSVGSEYRKNKYSDSPDDAIVTGDILGFNPALPSAGAFHVWEGFMETTVPLVAKQPFFEYLGLEGAVRVSDYSSVGQVTTYKGGGTWAPMSDIKFRAQYQQATRAPSVLELYQGGAVGFPTLSATVDPCLSTAADAATRAFCVSQGVPVGVAGTAAFNAARPTQYQSLTQGGVVAGFKLDAESSKTWTLGAVITPSIIPNFYTTIDWWSINVQKYIGGFGGGGTGVVQDCFANRSLASATCRAISRTQDGYLAIVQVPTVNNGGLKTSGIDIGTQYSMALPKSASLFNDGADLKLRADVSYRDKYDYQPLPGGAIYPCAGYGGTNQCGEPLPKWKGQASLTYASGPMSATVQYNYIGSWKNDAQLVGDTAANEAIPTVRAVHYFDLVGSYEFLNHYTFGAGVRNIFDKQPQMLPDTMMGSNQNTWSNTYDVLGRRYYMSLKVRY